MNECLIEVKNLTKKFKDFTAVDNLSFKVNKQDIFGFLGQNGAGKSTTMRMMITLIHPTEGNILINNKDLFSHRTESISKIGAIIERPDLYKYLSAYDNVWIFAKLSGKNITKKDIENQLANVGLQDVIKKKAGQFSQGMKQRLGIAIALIHNPDIVILDEPTNGLDPQGIAQMRQLIKSLSKDFGKTVIVSSHLLTEIEQVANRMIVIHKGKKLVEGEVNELLNPEKIIIDIESTNNQNLKTWLTTHKSNDIVFSENKNLLKINKIEIPTLIQNISAANIHILSIVPQNSLEDYFLNITNDF